MNWRPGLFRLWIVGSVLLVIAVAFISYGGIKAEFASDAAIWPDEILVPVLCANARGVAEADYIKMGDYCWYAMSIVRRLYPEYKDLSDNVHHAEGLCGSWDRYLDAEPMGDPRNVGSRRIRHSARGANSWIIPGVGFLRVRC